MLKMGCAKVDVTPPFPVFLRGYANRNRLTNTVEDPIETGIIALEKDGKKILIITVDTVGINYGDVHKISDVIAEKYNICYPDVIISCSHTHFAPGFSDFTITTPGGELTPDLYPPDDRYYDFWMSKVIPGIAMALADLEEVKLLETTIPVSCIAFNRRTVRKSDGGVTTNYIYPKDPENYNIMPIDTNFQVWKFMRGSHPKAVLGRYGCHPVTGGIDHYGISADYPGYFKQAIREKLGCPGFFMLGTAGDVVPIRRGGSSRKDIGEVLASAVKLHELTFHECSDFDLKTSCIMLELHSEMLKDKTLEELQENLQKSLEQTRSGERAKSIYMDDMRFKFFKTFNGCSCEMPIQLVKLGSKVLVCLPFEPFTKISSMIREKHPEAVIVSICGGYEGYLPLAEDFPKGGYETEEGTVFAPGTGDRIVAAAAAALDEF